MKTIEQLIEELDDIKEIINELNDNTQGKSIAAETHKVLREIYVDKQRKTLEQMNLIESLKKKKSVAYVTFGRFNPVTKGHEE